jgi:hypothetical protein
MDCARSEGKAAELLGNVSQDWRAARETIVRRGGVLDDLSDEVRRGENTHRRE